MTEPSRSHSYLARPDGLRLAYELVPGASPTIVFLPGYNSDMEGAKVVALRDWAEREGRAMLRLDYSGNGASEGDFLDGTLSEWRDDALFLIDALTEGPLVVVGSSMGGWLMLLIARARPDRVKGLVGIAAAPDFSDWRFSSEAKDVMARDGRIKEDSTDHPDGLFFTHRFWEESQANLLLGGPIPITAPVRLLQGQRDSEVPWTVPVQLADLLEGDDVEITLIKHGDHRLSRDSDIALLIRTVDALLRGPAPE